MAYRLLALVVVGVLITIGLYLYHERRKLQLRQEYAEFEGWTKIRLKFGVEIWQCPRCSLPCLSWAAVEQHDDGEQSACAWLAENGTELGWLLAKVREIMRGGDDGTPGPGEWNVSATVTGDEHTGAVDTLTDSSEPAPELEQYEDRATAFRELMGRINGRLQVGRDGPRRAVVRVRVQ